jgi:hypothetical protein
MIEKGNLIELVQTESRVNLPFSFTSTMHEWETLILFFFLASSLSLHPRRRLLHDKNQTEERSRVILLSEKQGYKIGASLYKKYCSLKHRSANWLLWTFKWICMRNGANGNPVEKAYINQHATFSDEIYYKWEADPNPIVEIRCIDWPLRLSWWF